MWNKLGTSWCTCFLVFEMGAGFPACSWVFRNKLVQAAVSHWYSWKRNSLFLVPLYPKGYRQLGAAISLVGGGRYFVDIRN